MAFIFIPLPWPSAPTLAGALPPDPAVGSRSSSSPHISHHMLYPLNCWMDRTLVLSARQAYCLETAAVSRCLDNVTGTCVSDHLPTKNAAQLARSQSVLNARARSSSRHAQQLHQQQQQQQQPSYATTSVVAWCGVALLMWYGRLDAQWSHRSAAQRYSSHISSAYAALVITVYRLAPRPPPILLTRLSDTYVMPLTGTPLAHADTWITDYTNSYLMLQRQT